LLTRAKQALLVALQPVVMSGPSWRSLMQWLRADRVGPVLLVIENVEAVLGTIVDGKAIGVDAEVSDLLLLPTGWRELLTHISDF
jgi:hypothetical protein